jgi:hypothetical protein
LRTIKIICRTYNRQTSYLQQKVSFDVTPFLQCPVKRSDDIIKFGKESLSGKMLDFLNFRLLIGLQIAASIGGQQAGHANALQLSSSAQAPQSASSCGLQCLNGGSCRQAVNSLAFYCDCTGTGYSGALCSQMISPEAPSLAALATAGKCKAPCQNGGTCTQAVNSLAYYCVCSGTGYSGANCSIPIVAQQTSDTGTHPPVSRSDRTPEDHAWQPMSSSCRTKVDVCI